MQSRWLTEADIRLYRGTGNAALPDREGQRRASEGGLLQGRQTYRKLSACALYISGLHVWPRKARGAQDRLFTSYLPGVSADALKHMRQVVRGWRIHRRTPATLAELAKQCHPTIRGGWNYFGAFYRTAMHKLSRYIDQRHEPWARRKYKTLLRRSVDWLGWMNLPECSTTGVWLEISLGNGSRVNDERVSSL